MALLNEPLMVPKRVFTIRLPKALLSVLLKTPINDWAAVRTILTTSAMTTDSFCWSSEVT